MDNIEAIKLPFNETNFCKKNVSTTIINVCYLQKYLTIILDFCTMQSTYFSRINIIIIHYGLSIILINYQ